MFLIKLNSSATSYAPVETIAFRISGKQHESSIHLHRCNIVVNTFFRGLLKRLEAR